MQGIETGAEGSVLKYVTKVHPKNFHSFSDNTIRMCDGVKCSLDGNGSRKENEV